MDYNANRWSSGGNDMYSNMPYDSQYRSSSGNDSGSGSGSGSGNNYMNWRDGGYRNNDYHYGSNPGDASMYGNHVPNQQQQQQQWVKTPMRSNSSQGQGQNYPAYSPSPPYGSQQQYHLASQQQHQHHPLQQRY